MDFEAYKQKLQKRKEKRKWQSTRHQQLALDCARALSDTDNKGFYFSIYKRFDNYALERCKEWVLSKKPDNPARMFKGLYIKFLNL